MPGAGQTPEAMPKWFQRGMQRGRKVRSLVETAIRETIHQDATTPGTQIHDDTHQIARDEIHSELAPGEPLRQGIIAEAVAAVPAPPAPPVIDVAARALDAMRDPATRPGFEAEVQSMVPIPPPIDPVPAVAAAMADPARRAPFDTQIAQVADARIAASGGITPGDHTRRDFLTALAGAGAAVLVCATGTAAAKALGFFNGTTTVYNGQPLPTSTTGSIDGGGSTTSPQGTVVVPTEYIGQTGDFNKTGPGRTVTFNQFVPDGQRLVVASVQIAGTRSYINGIMGAFRGNLQEAITDGVWGVWPDNTALDHFIGIVRQYIAHDSKSAVPYASSNIVIPQDWAGRLPPDVQAFVDTRNLQYT